MNSGTKNRPNSIYETLSAVDREIRLVTVVPSSLDPAVRVSLRTVTHALVKGKYYCLSYAWGSNSEQMPIMVNGQRHLVNCNLYSLLRRLRASKRDKDIWIDALCINQKDAVEKANQVSFMQSIYSDAAEVIIGLDNSRSYSIEDIPAQHALAAATLQGLADSSHLWQLDYFKAQCGAGDCSTEISSSFGQILDSSWFGRTWVVQETCLAKKAILLFPWGDLDWERFRDAFLNWNHHSETCCKMFAESLNRCLGDACNRMYHHVRCIAYTRCGLTGMDQHITEPMLDFQHLEVSDHRDKIYAFRGLHTAQTIRLPKPDYESMKGTFENFLLWFLEDQRSLYILCFDMCFGKVQGLNLPSWAPTWPTFTTDQGIERGNTAKARLKFLQLYCVAPDLDMDYEWDAAYPKRLRLNGISTGDKILAVSEKFFTGRETFTERVDLMKAWYQFVHPDHDPGRYFIQHMHESFCNTVLAGVFNEPLNGGPRLLIKDDIAIKELKDLFEGIEHDGDWYSCSPLQGTLIHSQDAALLDRLMFRTDHGRIGLGPRAARAGDEIYLLGGANVPFILRPILPGSHRLIGTSYIHGIMDEELEVGSSGDWVNLF